MWRMDEDVSGTIELQVGEPPVSGEFKPHYQYRFVQGDWYRLVPNKDSAQEGHLMMTIPRDSEIDLLLGTIANRFRTREKRSLLEGSTEPRS